MQQGHRKLGLERFASACSSYHIPGLMSTRKEMDSSAFRTFFALVTEPLVTQRQEKRKLFQGSFDIILYLMDHWVAT